MLLEYKKDNIYIEVEKGQLKQFTINDTHILNRDFKSWPKVFPILFPNIGISNHYSYHGKKYQLPKHGFWKDCEWDGYVTNSGIEMQAIVIKNKDYPFSFDLEVKFEVIKNGLKVKTKITNIDKEDGFFHFGLHPSFAIDQGSELIIKEEAQHINLKGEVVEGAHKVSKVINTIPFGEKFDTLIIPHTEEKEIKIINKSYALLLTHDFEHLAIWKPKHAKFICIEPWQGVSDPMFHEPAEVKNKRDIIKLKSCQSMEKEMTINYYEISNKDAK